MMKMQQRRRFPLFLIALAVLVAGAFAASFLIEAPAPSQAVEKKLENSRFLSAPAAVSAPAAPVVAPENGQ